MAWPPTEELALDLAQDSTGPPTEEQALDLALDYARPSTEEQALDLALDSVGGPAESSAKSSACSSVGGPAKSHAKSSACSPIGGPVTTFGIPGGIQVGEVIYVKIQSFSTHFHANGKLSEVSQFTNHFWTFMAEQCCRILLNS